MRTFKEFLKEQRQEENILTDPIKDMFGSWDGSYEKEDKSSKKKKVDANPLNDFLGRSDGTFDRERMKKKMRKK